MAKYYCYECGESFDFDDDGYQEHECPNCAGEDLVNQDTYDEEKAIADDPMGDMGGSRGYGMDEEGNVYAV
jgi:DNA-directed RNA polymerase subunit RPC12/RpoP